MEVTENQYEKLLHEYTNIAAEARLKQMQWTIKV